MYTLVCEYIFPIQEKSNVHIYCTQCIVHCTRGGMCLGVCMQCVCTYIHVCALCVRTLISEHVHFEWRVYTCNTMWYAYTYTITTHNFYSMYVHTTKRFPATLAILCIHTPHLHKQTHTLLCTSVYINTCILHKYSHILAHVYIYIYICEHVRISVCIHTCMHTRIHTCIHTRIHTCTLHKYKHTLSYTHMNTHFHIYI